jgi:alkanesulfonate monooxygenase SsuD/methylene tetrahydromethanopterin reductase-like flavin-dependent oxidoreductase (luciferase family)
MTDYGVCFHREQNPSTVATEARSVEAAGYDEFWVIEDCFYTSGPPLAAAALSATTDLIVGIGIVPSVIRTAALTAMEFATLARLAPGRFHGGVGHGVQSWMGQMGVRAKSPLTALDETVSAVRSLLRGENLTVKGRYVELHDVQLDQPPDPVPLVSAGVRRAKSLALSGRVADGSILAEMAGPDYIAWARSHIGDVPGHRITCFALMSVDSDAQRARTAVLPFLAAQFEEASPAVRVLPFYSELERRAAVVGWNETIRGMPAEYWSRVGAIGTPDDAARFLIEVGEAGADAVSIFPDRRDPVASLLTFARDVVALVR